MNTTTEAEAFNLAELIVKRAFEDKVDKAGRPYIEHIYRVCNSCPSIPGCLKLKTVALLHDLLEDCPDWNESVLRILFDDIIVDAVLLLTYKRGDGLSYEQYIDKLMINKYACIVKQKDLVDNMNVSRLLQLKENDIYRLKKYHAAYIKLTAHIGDDYAKFLKRVV